MGDRRGDVLRGKQEKGPDQSSLFLLNLLSGALINLFFQDLVLLYFELSTANNLDRGFNSGKTFC